MDDLLFGDKEERDSHDLAMKLRTASVDLEQVDDATGFGGIRISMNMHGQLEMKQEGMIDQVIEALGLDDVSIHEKWTPCEAKSLVKYAIDENAHREFRYSSVIGVLLYV